MSENDSNKRIGLITGNNQQISMESPQYFHESANTLFNFMKEFKFLEMAIKNLKLFPRYCIEDVRYLKLKSDMEISNIAMPMLCFCDINLHQIQTHIANYGSFGIGISKQWGSQAYRIQPINYINPCSPLREDLSIALQNMFDGKSQAEEANALLTQLKFSKPLYGKMNGTEKNFHDEHEWRYIPDVKEREAYGLLYDGIEYYRKWMNNKASMENMSDVLKNSKVEYGMILDPTKINYIFVENEEFVIKILDDINALDIEDKVKHLLMTKVVNLSQLKGDW
ncbi:abortive infection system antitoxin AbiGi family protein [Lactiplantibacillus dongliensis]|uniref:Abortive infection system antitoxin AbiGi family protein n=1 Tax=Lactiplantibacillus dongliensis TaxID=2559919 RepID=A0ABW1R331_9LACO|nr:abortive infection system antitoxin AbiGi family protein [Lactiplantibacillus dongliensis]